MIKAKIKFKFHLNKESENSFTMESAYEGLGETRAGAIQKAWEAMAAFSFPRQLIMKTQSIEVLSTQITPL